MEEVIGEHSPDMEKLRELAKQYPELGVALADTIDKIINPITSDEDATKEIDAFNRSHMKEKEGMYETVHLASSNREITVKYYRNGSVSISASFLS
jgi:phage-related tail protein